MSMKLNSGYQIVIPADCGISGEYAANELAKYLAQIVGIAFPIVKDENPEQEKEIAIGKTNRTGTPDNIGLKNDGFILRTNGEKLFIFGENDRANLYGVYYLLERYLDCGFYSYEVEKIPANPKACLPAIDDTRISPLEYRETFWYEPQKYEELAIKRGFNGA